MKPRTEFPQLSYLGQVRALRSLAESALESYPLSVREVRFINHGENTTFRVTARDKRLRGRTFETFLLRVHRDDYHSDAGILEELGWLDRLASEGLRVPGPVRNRAEGFLTVGNREPAGPRRVSLFRWVEGRFIWKSLSLAQTREIGALLARIQKVGLAHAGRSGVRVRRYWTSEGLLGAKPKFGPIDRLQAARPDEQRLILRARDRVFAKLRAYERRHPERMGLIHADLHFGNLLSMPDGAIGAIDFDDCGHGFHVYDLAIPLLGISQLVRDAKRPKDYARMKEALIEGYSARAPWSWTSREDELLGDLVVARRVLMLGWLQSRSDNPKIARRLRKITKNVVKYLKNPNL